MSEKEKFKKESSVEKPAAKKPAAKKPAAKKTAAKKTVAKKTVAKKLSVKNNITTSSSNDKAVYTPTLQSYYTSSIVSSMQKKFKYTNVMQVPKIVSINLNMGLGDAKSNSKNLESSLEEMSLISGQKPITTKAKKDISNFKIRKGWPVGCKVTLRSKMMYEFLDRLISVALPRTRDFRGLSFKSFDGRGNYNFGIKEQIIFTEIDYDRIQSINGLNVTITTSASSDNEAYELLKLFGLPLREKPKKNEVEEAA